MKRTGLYITIIVLVVGAALGIGALKLDLLPAGIANSSMTDDAAPEDDHAHGDEEHDHGDEKTSQVTVWGERFEVFLEHPYLVAGSAAQFVTHVSDLTTGQPRTAGPVVFVLTAESGLWREYVEHAPARAGIYLPQIIFPEAGRWAVTLKVPVEGLDHEVILPAFTVYGSQAEADAAPEVEAAQGASFLKEQQWPIRMKVQQAAVRPVGGKDVLTIPQTSVIGDHDEPAAFVQVAGETLQERHIMLGAVDAGYVEVILGIIEGEQVVYSGVEAVEQAMHGADDSGHAHGPDDGHGHDEVQTSQDSMSRFDIATSVAGPGTLEFRTTLTGEVRLNADRVAHIVPQVSGKVRDVIKNVGDTVAEGEVAAWLESTTLGQAKIDYLSKFAELSCCAMELTRAREVHDNANRLLEALASSPSLETLRDTDWGAMGKVRSDLVSAYAELQYAQATYDREKQLFEKKITSADDFRKSESALKKAGALYEAARDRVAFDVQYELLEATRAQRVREFEVIGAERSLYVLGLKAADILALQTLGAAQSAPGVEAEVCTDPNCADCAKEKADLADGSLGNSVRENERLAWYPLSAPFDGTVISKHLSLGESVKDGADVFVIADLATVWVDFRIHQKDLPAIEPGQTIVIESGPDRAEGVIAYLAPVVDEDTRTALARVTLPNPDGRFRPGTFVNGIVTIRHAETPVVIEKTAIQYIDDQPCVFVHDGYDFEKRNVLLGRTDGRRVEIKAGLQPGENVVTKNAFRVKSEAEKAKTASSGHGHVH